MIPACRVLGWGGNAAGVHLVDEWCGGIAEVNRDRIARSGAIFGAIRAVAAAGARRPRF